MERAEELIRSQLPLSERRLIAALVPRVGFSSYPWIARGLPLGASRFGGPADGGGLAEGGGTAVVVAGAIELRRSADRTASCRREAAAKAGMVVPVSGHAQKRAGHGW